MKSYSEVQSTSVAAIHSNKSSLVKGNQPLKNFSFYLDITNSQISRKLEEQIEELGGSLKFFLTKEVTHFITDKTVSKLIDLNSPQTPISGKFSGSTESLKLANEIKGTPKTKSRADAMLNRALQGATEFTTKSPIQFAKELGTLVWHTTHALKFLKKIYADKTNNSSKKVAHSYNDKQATELKNHFIKIESLKKGYRPYYQILKQLDWPTIQLRDKKNGSINKKSNRREASKSNSNGMTRKSRSSKHISFKRNNKSNSSEKQCGFCELCKVEYDQLTAHLKTKDHCNYVKNETNFAVLDSLINTSSNVNDFLNHSSNLQDMFPINKIENDQTQSLIENSPTCVRQTRQSTTRQSGGQTNKKNQESGNCRISDSNNHIAADEISCNTNDVYNNKGSRKSAPSKKSKLVDSPPLRHSIPKSLIYKVIEPKETDSKQSTKTQLNEENITPAIIVKIRKIRQTELSILNVEAESFMFPKRMSSDTITDEDRHTTSEVNRRSSSIISSDCLLNETDQVNSSVTNVTNNEAKRKRRTVRTSVSDTKTSAKEKRPSYLDKSMDEEEEDENKVKSERTCADILKSDRLMESQFAFERVPHYESWYNAFQRQDKISERIFEYYGNTVYRRLPYEMGPKPMDNSTYCKLCFKNKSASESNVNNCSLNTIPCDSNNTEVKIEKDDQPMSSNEVIEKPSKARLFKDTILNFDAPRKSPREHASTLAILSCLMKQRSDPTIKQKERTPSIKGDTRKRKFKAEEDVSSVDTTEEKVPKIEYVPEISETVKCLRRGQTSKFKNENITPLKKFSKSNRAPNKNKTKPSLQLVSKDCNSQPEKQYTNVSKQQKEIEQFLLSSNSIDDDSSIAMSLTDSALDVDYEFSNHIDLRDIIEGDHYDCFDKTGGSRYRYYKLFSVNKKRKNNKTGWPKKKRTSLTQQRKCRNINFKDFNHVDYEKSLTKSKCEQISSISPLSSSKNKFYENYNYTEDDNNDINCFTQSVCEKLETSGIFNVSSDSMDTLETECQITDQNQKNCSVNKRADSRLSMDSELEYDKSNDWNEIKSEKEMNISLNHSLESKRKKCALQIPNRTKSPICQNNHDMSTSSTTVSPRKLRKPRGCLYRER